ncbi:TIGR03085 family metal-binding protein [Microtetraspora malaysiensis]|uniref:TIGR03085 family metal-binding protein n=1 Tax=Microtetraspora malaysiensis TaxID=161358 RepID=UPI003D928ED9
MTHSRSERAALCDLLDDLGPDAPTLCAGWTTADLAAHLAVRERRPDALPGIGLGALAPYTASVQERLKARHSYLELVDLVRQGPPKWTPYGLIPGIDELINTVEMFVHHEDVRRARPDWEPRKLPAGLDDVLWQRLRLMARLFFRRSPVGVVLRRTNGEKAAGRMAEPAVVAVGDAQELMLLAFGRQAHARVSYEGDPAAVTQLREARLGM